MENEAVFVRDNFDVVEHQATVHVDELFAEHVEHAFGTEFAFGFAQALQHRLQLGSFLQGHLVAELRDDFVHGGTAALAREAERIVLVTTDDRVINRTVSALLHVLRLGSAILMDATAVDDSFSTDQRSADVYRHAAPVAHENCSFVNAFEMQSRFDTGIVQANRHFVEVRVAATFAEAVQSDFQLGCTDKETFNGSSRCHAEVVMAVHRNRDVLGQSFVDLLDLVDVELRAVAFHRVRQVDRRSTGFDNSLQNVNHKIHVFEAVTKMFGAEFHIALVANERLCKLHALHSLFLDLFGRHVQHVFHGQGACSEERMDARMRSVLDSFPAALDIAFDAASEARNHDVLCSFVAFFRHLSGELCKFHDRFKIHFARGRETDFGTLHTELQEQQINIFFLGVVPGLRKSLVTITQCYVIEEWFSRFSHFYLLAGFKTAKFL